MPEQMREWLSMHDYEVIWSRESIYDVVDIVDYIEQRFGKDRADRFNDEIDAECETLGTDYKLYTGTRISYRGKIILKKVFDPSIIFYFVDDTAEKVYIIRILRHERNWQKILKEGLSYTFE